MHWLIVIRLKLLTCLCYAMPFEDFCIVLLAGIFVAVFFRNTCKVIVSK